MTLLRAARCFVAAAAALPAAAQAHFFTQPYTLPIPFSMYAYGAAAALLLSFAIVGVFASVPARLQEQPPILVTSPPAPGAGARIGLAIARAISVALLVLCIATGLFGTQNPFANFSMTFFWILFVLGVPYAVCLVGDFYAAINPWKAIVAAIERATASRFNGRLRDPARWGCAPALGLYLVFIWIELFASLRPRGLAIALLVYTGINIGGAWLFGRAAWFAQGEFFAIFMRLIGRMSPRAQPWDPDEPTLPGPRWRAPLVGLLDERLGHISFALFILFMLSSTAFDGLHSTLPWVTVYWKTLYPQLAPWLGGGSSRDQVIVAAQAYHIWQWCSLGLLAFAYYAVFVAFVAVVRMLTGSTPVRGLVLRFATSLVPIAFVYHMTHYYTLLLAQGAQIVKLASDPFGYGWNLFGTGHQDIAPFMIDVNIIWHTQVALIVLGHMASVYLAHLEALRLFATPRRAMVSQVPMLILMMLFTTLGLWILSMPLAAGA